MSQIVSSHAPRSGAARLRPCGATVRSEGSVSKIDASRALGGKGTDGIQALTAFKCPASATNVHFRRCSVLELLTGNLRTRDKSTAAHGAHEGQQAGPAWGLSFPMLMAQDTAMPRVGLADIYHLRMMDCNVNRWPALTVNLAHVINHRPRTAILPFGEPLTANT